MPSLTRRSARTTVTKDYAELTDDELPPPPTKVPKRKRVTQSDEESAHATTADEADSDLTPLEEEDEYGIAALKRTPKRKPAKKRARKDAAVAKDENTDDTMTGTDGTTTAESSPAKTPAKKRGRKTKSATADGEEGTGTDGTDGAAKTPKKRKARAPKPDPTYVIPDVEKKSTTFKGRLGEFASATVYVT
jgi:hypothetical protein